MDDGLSFLFFLLISTQSFFFCLPTDRAANKRQDERIRIRQIYVPELIIRLHYLLYSSRQHIPGYVLPAPLGLSILMFLFFHFLFSFAFIPETSNAPSNSPTSSPTPDTGYMKPSAGTVGGAFWIISRLCGRLYWREWRMGARIRLELSQLFDHDYQ